MPISPIIKKPFNFLGDILVDSNLATQSEIGSVKKIFGYCKREGAGGFIQTVCHRIWNSVKAVFGHSDWQRAEKASISILIKFFTHVHSEGLIGEDELAKARDGLRSSKLKKDMNSALESCVKKMDHHKKRIENEQSSLNPIMDKLLDSLNKNKFSEDLRDNPKRFVDLLNTKNMNFRQCLKYASAYTHVPGTDLSSFINPFLESFQ
jgi:hypothetical protein